MSKPEGGRQFRPLSVPNVKISGFWGDRQDAICEHTAETLLDRCIEAGMLDQIDVNKPSPGIVIPRHSGLVSTQMFWDSDIGKSIETIAYSLYRRPNPRLEARVDEIVDMYERLQASDGYLNSWFQRIEPDKRWTNLRDTHELYCAGHLMEAAVAYDQATGKGKLLDIMCRYADHMITVFGHGPGQLRGYCGHEEIELALVKLARVTGERKYLDLAKYFIDERGREPHFFTEEAVRDGRDPEDFVFGTYEYNQAHLPVRRQTMVVGHAVRAMYLYSGMADIATEFKDDSLTSALETLWSDLTEKQMYITGGIGPAASNEGFTDYYDLPNDTAYAETCASVGLVFWAGRMLGRGPDRRYADMLEQALYNGALAGLSLDGRRFFYENPLESTGKHHRWTWHHCPCCPPNIARLIASIGAYMYGVADNEIAVHLYCESVSEAELGNGVKVRLAQNTDYPWGGRIGIGVSLEQPARFALSLRIPEWAKGATLAINGEPADLGRITVHGYARIERDWSDSDWLELDLPLKPRLVWAHPNVRQDAGRVAVMRGPLVYCLEGADNGVSLNTVILSGDLSASNTASIREIPGAVAVELPVVRERVQDWGTGLYRESAPTRQDDHVRLVPYHLWDNRAPGEMLVWLRSETRRG